jgi:hypothetical protein
MTRHATLRGTHRVERGEARGGHSIQPRRASTPVDAPNGVCGTNAVRRPRRPTFELGASECARRAVVRVPRAHRLRGARPGGVQPRRGRERGGMHSRRASLSPSRHTALFPVVRQFSARTRPRRCHLEPSRACAGRAHYSARDVPSRYLMQAHEGHALRGRSTVATHCHEHCGHGV